ncbi:GFA family protein [Desulfopila sp. IMCC35008]|uniref:GFA family protein n=1 Tax=Desulfopila sp. IMCC35008 TaxID=2653858 RepID=UPI00197AA3DF
MLRCNEQDLRIISGRDELTLYRFNTMVAEHYFCQKCGIYTFHKMRKAPDKYAVNAGCLEGVDPYGLQPASIRGSAK